MVNLTATYRLQLRDSFGFDDAAAITDYLARLGVSHAYLSPILTAVPGSAHGYDVVDHEHLSADAGGRPAFDRLIGALRSAGLAAVADVVPNHMAVPTPARLNAPLWSVLAEGPSSPYASWFDLVPGSPLLMPVLGAPLAESLDELAVDHSVDPPVLRYYEHEFPLAAGTSDLPLPELLAAQHYRLAWWRVGSEELDYRRFFDVTSLIAVRVEDGEVFAGTHRLLLDLLASGDLEGLRIDHPDGLADPRGYLRQLASASGAAWVVVEKILEGDEELPADWPCAGTTGYDALNAVQGLFTDPHGRSLQGASREELEHAEEAAKRLITDEVLRPEIRRLTDILARICAGDLQYRDLTAPWLEKALVELLIAMDRYRAYVVPGEPAPAESVTVLDRAASKAALRLRSEPLRRALAAVRELTTSSGDALRDEFAVRFQQTCGPVMAKGIEDTLFYRGERLSALNEVGADPQAFGLAPGEFHAFAGRLATDWPATLTTLSTHDTKRSEDARARLLTLAEVPSEWEDVLAGWCEAASRYSDDPPPPNLFWQNLLAVWDGPPPADRILGYLQKALREAKTRTSWLDPDEAYEAEVEAYTHGVLGDAGIAASITAFLERIAPGERANVLGQKLVQLTMPGVPDVYQGCEIVDRSLVDPDNRRPVDYARRSALLASLDAGEAPSGPDGEKLLVVSRALRLRRRHPEWFAGGYTALDASSEHAVAFARDGAVTVATRLGLGLASSGGFGDATVALPSGDWTDALTGRAASPRLADLLSTYPVALLVRA